jgi:FSR family fosmidomycin resistance protein-like MFS transporter
MTITQQREDAVVPSPCRRMRLWALAHAIDDLYQGLVPSVVPYFVLDRHYGYVAASGLTLAATIGSSIPQPFLGTSPTGGTRAGWPGPGSDSPGSG